MVVWGFQSGTLTSVTRLREVLEGFGPVAPVVYSLIGATEAIFNAIHAVVRAGEEVIVLDPCYDCYEPAIELAGATAVHVPLDPATFAPDWDAVRAAITPKTRMLMVNSPHNPSGAMFTAADSPRYSRGLA